MLNSFLKQKYLIRLNVYQQTRIPSLYHGTKSDILRRFDVISLPVPESVESSVLIVELSPILRHDFKPDTSLHFAHMVYDYIIKVGQDYDRIDVICNRYFEKSLKTQTGDLRGSGNILAFDDDAPFPKNFKESFLKNSTNKENLNHYLALKLLDIHNASKSFTVTKANTIKTNNDSLLLDSTISHGDSEEADEKLIRHAIQCIRSGVKHVIKTVDTDVLILAIANRYYAGDFELRYT